MIAQRNKLELTVMMTSAQVVETSVTVTPNSSFSGLHSLQHHNVPSYDMTRGFKPLTFEQIRETKMTKDAHPVGQMTPVTLSLGEALSARLMQ